MDIITLLRILFRRWIVLVPLLALTVGSAYMVMRRVDPAYEAKASVLFLPSSLSQEDPSNPFQQISQAIETTAQAIALVLTDGDVARTLASNERGTYTITPEKDSPIIHIRVTADQPEWALATLDGVLTDVDSELRTRQARVGSPEKAYIQASILTRSSKAKALYGSRVRSVAATIVVGICATVVAALITEALAQRRRARRDKTASVPRVGRMDPETDLLMPVGKAARNAGASSEALRDKSASDAR